MEKQADRILDYMRRYGSITQLEAMRDLGCMRLASRISDLRAAWHEIERDMVKVPTRDGTTKVARYRLGGSNER